MESALDEWEKNHVKVLFKEYDKDKLGAVKDDLKRIVRRLCNDECFIGKVPNIEDSQVDGMVDGWPTNGMTGKLLWLQFKERLNSDWNWRMTDRE